MTIVSTRGGGGREEIKPWLGYFLPRSQLEMAQCVGLCCSGNKLGHAIVVAVSQTKANGPQQC